jgi:hypothetical protein
MDNDLYHKFLLFEKNNGLFVKQWLGVYFWKLIRIEILDSLIIANDSNNISHSKKKNYYLFFKILLGSFKRFSKVKKQNFDRLVIANGRYVKSSNGKFIDHIMQDAHNSPKSKLILYLPTINGDYPLIETNDNPLVNLNNYFDIVSSMLINKLSKLIMIRNELFSELQKILDSEFDNQINISYLINSRVLLFLFMKYRFKKILKKYKPKEVYLGCAYGKEHIISASIDEGVSVIEMQHGIIHKNHFGYHYPFSLPIPYTPHEILVYGNYWLSACNYPVNTKIRIQSFSYNRNRIDDVIRTREDELDFMYDVLLIIYENTPLKIIKKIVESHSLRKFVLKLHPVTKGYIDGIFYKDIKLTNLIVYYDEYDIYSLFMKSKVAVFDHMTTVIYESLSCGVPSFYVYSSNLYNQFDEKFIENYKLEKFDFESDLDDILSNPIRKPIRDFYA